MERAVLRKLASLCVVCGLVAVALLGATALRDGNRQWKDYQNEYKALLLKKLGPDVKSDLIERVAGMKPEIRQVVVDDLGAVDRCTSCHLGVDDNLFADAPQPFTTHPRLALLESHPVEKFGCTVCHGGQGSATTYEGAAHENIAHWTDPMVEKDFIQSRCGYCHKDYEGIEAQRLVEGKRLFKELHCAGCHKVEAEDGAMAPPLHAFADKDHGSFDFTRVEGEPSVQNWVRQHFLDPPKVSPGSPMRIYAMNDEQLEALTTYVLSLTEKGFPLQYYTKKELALFK